MSDLDRMEEALGGMGIYLSWVPPGHAKDTRGHERDALDALLSLRARVAGLEQALRGVMLAEPPKHAAVTDGCAWKAADMCVWCSARAALEVSG